MHRVDTSGHVGNQFDNGDPLIPRLPTIVDAAILNAFQEELANAILTAGVALVKGTNDQLAGVMANLNQPQVFTAYKVFDRGLSARGHPTATDDTRHGVTSVGGAKGGRGGSFQGTKSEDNALVLFEGIYAKGADGNSGNNDGAPGAVLEGGAEGGVGAVLKATTNAQAAGRVEGWLDLSGSNTPATAPDKMLTPQGILRAACRLTGITGGFVTANSTFNIFSIVDGGTGFTVITLNANLGTEVWPALTDWNIAGTYSVRYTVTAVDTLGTGGRTRITIRPVNVSTGAGASHANNVGCYLHIFAAN